MGSCRDLSCHELLTLIARCCSAHSGYNLSSVPCDPTIPVIPESETQEDNSYTAADAHTSDPSEYVTGQMVGDSFPDVDRQALIEAIGDIIALMIDFRPASDEEGMEVETQSTMTMMYPTRQRYLMFPNNCFCPDRVPGIS